LLPQTTKRNKKKTGRPRMDKIEKRLQRSSMSYVRGVSVESITKNSWLAHQVQYMTDFKNGEEIWCIFRRMWINGLKLYDEKVGINWKWQSMDGV
jgi:hypothetical protein